jgi:NAD(P)-dependent dehydrogenase (short-subunit alcohol dehydrogenase family)
MQFEDKTVIVTGAASGIGKTLAAEYARSGANVVLVDIKAKEGKSSAAAARALGGRAVFVKADVGVEADVKRLMAHSVSAFGAIHILINNAGISPRKPVLKLSVKEWDTVLRTNLTSAFLCAREATPHIRKNKSGGSIVNIASTRALMSEPDSEAYAASKGGIVALTHALALSLGPQRIRVNCILPGWIQTQAYDELRKVDHAQHPAGRVGRPEDIANACFYLTDAANDFVTGANIVVDGGMTRKMIYEA